MTKETNCKKNIRTYCISMTLYNTALIFISGSILQAFLLESGIGEKVVARDVAIFQLVQSISMLLFSGVSDKIKNVIKSCAWLSLNTILLLLPMLYYSMVSLPRIDENLVILIAGCFSNTAVGLYNIIVYKLPYHIMNMRDYGKAVAVSGFLYGVSGILVSFFMTFFIKRYEYFSVMKIVLILCIIMTVIAFVLGLRYIKISGNVEEKKQNNKINLLKYKPFLLLCVPNFLRGFGNGIVMVVVTIGYYFKIIDKVSSSYVVILTNAGVLLSCLLYSKIAKKGRNAKITLYSSIVTLFFLSGMFVGNSTIIFLICYAVAYFAVNLLGNAIPVFVTEIVDYEVLGQYTAWRMLLFTIGSALSSFVAIKMAENLGGLLTMCFAGVMFLITGIGYYVCEKAV